ncbi:hypothetical protein HPC49_29545 [Pyxidicoccus fallax]|uniref:Uncharacterized protein n=1 Tax=Pyxidicoccus fallax TaxID=394095 RepID=A0A848LD69_9BACT|nr:hypothetical protein [Pyxidicoccus fallax]NMO14755.1 hypothetical protein [Pyxidicoccus fallax]NPC82352.1 hypothetical protein [Pyxidicoccus fallax]
MVNHGDWWRHRAPPKTPFLDLPHRPGPERPAPSRTQTGGGAYEAHITVSARSEEDLRRFRDFCDAASVKCIVIELGRGAEPFQPMTASYHHGTLQQAREEAQALARALVAEGFHVTRLKLEALGKNRDIPEDDATAKAWPAGYFEFHVKVLLPAGMTDMEALRACCEKHGAHLSRNARKVREDGVSERFVTLRVYGLGRANADVRFTALLEDLAGTGLKLTQRLREWTVYDSNHGMDRGWLEDAT